MSCYSVNRSDFIVRIDGVIRRVEHSAGFAQRLLDLSSLSHSRFYSLHYYSLLSTLIPSLPLSHPSPLLPFCPSTFQQLSPFPSLSSHVHRPYPKIQLGSLGSPVSSPSGVRGETPTAEVFLCIFSSKDCLRGWSRWSQHLCLQGTVIIIINNQKIQNL